MSPNYFDECIPLLNKQEIREGVDKGRLLGYINTIMLF